MRTGYVRLVILLTFALLNVLVSSAQNAQTPRTVEKIDESVLVPLRGNTLPIANAKTDSGRVRPDLAMTDLVLVLSRSAEQQAKFDDFVSSQYDPSSASFHQWLEPGEVGERFGPSLEDIAIISKWLTGHGLAIAGVSKDRMVIRFGGTAAQVESTFHTEIHNLQVNGRRHIANMSDPKVPAALATVVVGVKALNDFHPRPLHRLGGEVQFNSSTGMWQRIVDGSAANLANSSAETASARPEFGITVSTQSGSYPVEDISPYDFATIYNVLPLWNAGIDGTGQTIAIVATSDVNADDIASYRKIFGLPVGPALNTIIANGTDPGQCTSTSGDCTIGDLFENTLDVEVSGAVAKGAQIDLVVSGPTSPLTDPVYSSASYVIENDTAKILNVSYGLCELFMGTSGNAAYNNLWETAAVEGIAVFVATGDSGSPTCEQGFDTTVPYGAQYGLAVSGMASTPYDTAVGGTDFAWCRPTIDSTGHTVGCTNVTPFWNAGNNSTTGASAANYVTEIPWNDSCASPQAAAYLESLASFLKYSGVTDAEKACNFVVNNFVTINQQYNVDLSFFVDSVGGGGGASNCTINNADTANPDPASCSGGYAKPSWQSNVSGITSDGKRDIPDVSFFAGNGLWNSATLVCVSAVGPCLSSTTPTTEPMGQEVGGTSVAAPEMAGVMALINQKTGAAQGNPNAELYALAAKQSYSSCTAESVKTSTSCYFNDIDTGTIATPCQAGARNCTVAHSGDTWGILSGFSAGRGFDEATGLGSLNIANVVNNWRSVGGTATAMVTVTPSQTTIALNQALTVAVTVSGSSGAPTGNVGLAGGGYVGTAGVLSGGSYTFTIPAYSLVAGSDTLTISYGGDSTYAGTSATTSVTVTKLAPIVTVTATPSTVGANGNVSLAVTVTGGGPTPTGSIQFTGGGYTGTCTLASGTCSVTIASSSLHNGVDTLTATYSGDNNYASRDGATTVTVHALVPTVTVTPSLKSLNTANPLLVTVTVTGTGAVPTGSVELYGILGGNPGNGYGLGATLSGGSYTFTLQPASLYPGTDTLYAVYSGDSTYVPTTVTTTVSVTKSTPSITVTPSATSIQSNDSLTLSGRVSGLVGQAQTLYETVSVTGGGYSASGIVSFGAIGTEPNYTIVIPPGSLSAGSDTLTVTYTGDMFSNAVSSATIVNVTQWVKVTSSVTVTPASSSIDSSQPLDITISVTGGYGTPTGLVSLSGGGFNGPAQLLTNGSYTYSVPGYTLTGGTDTFTATYNGDATYLTNTATANVSVTQSVFAISAAAATPTSVAKGGSATSAISISSSTNYGGAINLNCALTSGPSNQNADLPICYFTTGGPFQVGGTTTALVKTVAATSGAMLRPERPNAGRSMAAGATVLAFVLLCGIPAGRRRWRAMFGLVALVVALGSLAACGGGGGGGGTGGGGGGGGNGDPGTSSGTYTFTVTATSSPSVTPNPTATFAVTVN